MTDSTAFEELYRATYRRIYALMARMAGNRQAAEDLTQEAYVRAWQSIGSFRGESSFATWLRAIAVRTAFDHGRAEIRRSFLVAADEAPEPVARSVRIDASIDLERAIAALPAGARHVLVLHDIAGYRHEEIAGLLDIAVGTAKSQLHRARQLILREVNHGL